MISSISALSQVTEAERGTETRRRKKAEATLKYYLSHNRIKHEYKCQSDICVKQRERCRVSPKKRYENNTFCMRCETPWGKEQLTCLCCSHINRSKSRQQKSRFKNAVRY